MSVHFWFLDPWQEKTSRSMDTQTTHKQDELYYIFKGTGRVRIGRSGSLELPENAEVLPLTEGDLIYVPRGCWHRLEADADGLAILVVFAPNFTG